MDELGIIEQGVDWRTRLGQDIRDCMINDILFSLQTKLQSTTTALIDLQKVAVRIEERIHTIASDYGDYLRRICLTRGDLDSYDVFLNDCQRQQASIRSSILLHQENKQGVLSNQVALNDHKEHSHPYEKDMISKLPNDLVQHIMSFLSMREAVRTSVLSHWWVNQWTFLKSIQLNIYWFHMDREKFSSFLDKLLLSRVQADAPMDTFELKSFAIDRANYWINHAIKHNAKVLKFAEYGKWEPFYLDPNLVELSSRYLETLELTNVALDATIFNQLANACPALQNMLLTDCLLEVEEISSSSLKNLDIIDCYILKDLSICTPSLVSLCIKNERTDNSSFRNSYLIFATAIIIDASNVSSMELLAMDRQFTFVEKDGGEPMFKNLRNLSLGLWCITNMFSPLRRFVRHSPMLRMVTLRISPLDWKSHLTKEHQEMLISIRNLFDGMQQGAAGQAGPSGGGGGGGGGADRLSALPDAVLFRIVSHLGARQAVRTSVLSKRWRHVWASAPRVDVRHPCACDERADQERFHGFVTTMLLRRRPFAPIKALRLCWSHDGDANNWIAHAVRRGAEEIDFSARHHLDDPKPELEYTSFISHKIKILKLTRVRMGIKFITQICYRCTFLEELELKNVNPLEGQIQSTSLKRLSIINCFISDGFLVDAPNLISLCFFRPLSGKSTEGANHSSDNRSWPFSASVWEFDDDGSDHDDDFFAIASGGEHFDDKRDNESDQDNGSSDEDSDDKRDHESDHDDDVPSSPYSDSKDSCDGNDSECESYESGDKEGDDLEDCYSNDMLENLIKVAKGLTAYHGEVLLRRQLENFPMFNNLKTLSLGEWCMVPDFSALSTILKKSPKVERLYLHLDMIHRGRGDIDPSGGSFACNNLKKVKITCCKDDEMVHMLKQFLQRNGISLEKIVHHTSSTHNGKEDGGGDSSAKRKAQGEVARLAVKQRRARNSNLFDGMHQGAARQAGPSGGGGGGGADRLSALPDAALFRIVSHLTARQAVRTSVLSKRWRHVWASAPRVDIRHPCACDERADQERFGDFVTTMLLNRRPFAPIKALRLWWSHDGDAETWIAHAVRRGAEEIDFSARHHQDDPKPELEYTSFISPKIKILKLTTFGMDIKAITHICSRCTSLEELELKDFRRLDGQIRSASLKRLSIINCFISVAFLVDAPNLISLCFIRPLSFERTKESICSSDNRRWPAPVWKDDNDGFDHDDIFAIASGEHFDDKRENESDQDYGFGDGSDDYIASESDHDDDGPPSPYSVSYDGDNECESYEPRDKEESDRTVAYGEIADEYSSNGDPSDEYRGNYVSHDSANYGRANKFGNLKFPVKSIVDASAHEGELLLRRLLENFPMFNNLDTLSLGEWCMVPDFSALSTILTKSPNAKRLYLHLDVIHRRRRSIDPSGGSFSCNNLEKVKITCCKDDVMVHMLAQFLQDNGVSPEKIFVRRTSSPHNGKEGRGSNSSAKRKAQGEVARLAVKQRRARNSELFDGMHQGAAGPRPSGGGGDRLSALPDAVLLRIVSHLKAREAVRTSGISRRWRHVWASAPRVDVRYPCACDGRAVDQKRFRDFVTILLLRRRPLAPFKALRLSWSHDEDDVNAWIAHAVRRGAEEIDLSARRHQGYPVPDYKHFISPKIKILKLTHLRTTRFTADNTLDLVCSGCTSLEELELKDIKSLWGGIQSDSLKRLSIINCHVTSDGFLVEAPNLISLCCIRPVRAVPWFSHMVSLVEATVVLDDSRLSDDYQQPVLDDDDDGSDYDDCFFAPKAEGSDDKRDNEADNDSGDKKNRDGSESDLDDHDGEYDHEDGDKEVDDLEGGVDRTVTYGEIADESSSYGIPTPTPSNEYGGNYGNHDYTILGGDHMLDNLSDVRTLGLLGHQGEMLLRRQLENCPIFNNLNTLTLGEWCMAPDFSALSTILENSPHVERLYLNLDMDIHRSRGGINPTGGSFACNNLKKVKITCRKDDVMVHMLAKFLQRNGISLQKIFVRRTSSTHNGEEGTGKDSSAKRKAQDEAARRAVKQLRRARNSNPFDGMQQGAAGQAPRRDDGEAAGPSGGGGGGGEDRISALPDAVLGRIVSHLKTWQAVRTSVLSKRWRDVWASAPRVDIRHPCACDERADQERFHGFVDTLLLRRRPFAPIKALRLCWTHDGDANNWIAHAVRRGAEEIELSTRHHQGSLEPEPEFTSFISPKIKILKLTRVGMDIRSITQICSRCTSLEELELDDVRLLEGQIQSASLKRLSIIKCYIDDGFLVDAPNLVSLCFIRPLGIERKGGANSSSDRLWWPVWLNDDDGYDHDDDFFANASAVQSDDKRGSKSDQDDLEGCNDDDRTVAYDEIADEYSSNGGPGDEHGGYSESDDSTICGPYGLFNVLVKTSLIMIAREGELLLRRELENFPMFINLNTLSLGEWCMVPDFSALSTILEKSPNVERLYLHLDMVHRGRGDIDPSGGSFACNNLKKVKITCCEDDVMVHKLAEFLEANGLQRQRIFVRRTSRTRRDSRAKQKEQEDHLRLAKKW
uniref:F-box domain-containing protein n=1 Tax=Oryza meridionalis TaxID=40149 RepID=A0A0E0EIX3_9ORYZ